MPVSQGSAGGLAGMTLKAWGWVRAGASPALLRGFNVASVAVSGSNTAVTFTNAMATSDYVVRQWMANNSSGVFWTATGLTTAGFSLGAQTAAQSGVAGGNFYFEVWE